MNGVLLAAKILETGEDWKFICGVQEVDVEDLPENQIYDGEYRFQVFYHLDISTKNWGIDNIVPVVDRVSANIDLYQDDGDNGYSIDLSIETTEREKDNLSGVGVEDTQDIKGQILNHAQKPWSIETVIQERGENQHLSVYARKATVRVLARQIVIEF